MFHVVSVGFNKHVKPLVTPRLCKNSNPRASRWNTVKHRVTRFYDWFYSPLSDSSFRAGIISQEAKRKSPRLIGLDFDTATRLESRLLQPMADKPDFWSDFPAPKVPGSLDFQGARIHVSCSTTHPSPLWPDCTVRRILCACLSK